MRNGEKSQRPASLLRGALEGLIAGCCIRAVTNTAATDSVMGMANQRLPAAKANKKSAAQTCSAFW